ncbi:hypothetical protein [Blastopirellula marina]|uniref:Uncharacterized protein n=1 Tax=Blastopirellula marina TaxID=124 RepID=A0A2S8GNU6_9BACT|nr:hypothetical protein [Blastopirellula marina]PQO46097.1 hypothetical protein C5Y93_11010 [Blastopirellula marina]
MADAEQLLQWIEEGIVTYGEDLGGWTRLHDGALQLFDGRITLRAEHFPQESPTPNDFVAHCHVYATLHEYDDEVLDACLFGMADDLEAALRQVAGLWITCVAGPIRSFLDNKPVSMTCQAGVEGGDLSAGYAPGDFGLSGLRAFVGPSVARGFEGQEEVQTKLDDSKPWFRYAAESAAPRRVHLVKATILVQENGIWDRELEIDGHEVAHHDPNWPAGIACQSPGYMTRFAVFEYPRNSQAIAHRQELERTIDYFIDHFSNVESVDALMEQMIDQGFDPDMVHDVESTATIAFGRTYFQGRGIQYSPTIIRARRSGKVEPNVPLMSLPVYNRALALCSAARERLSEEEFQSLCIYNAESQALLQAIEGGVTAQDLPGIKLYPSIVPQRGVSQQTMDAAMAVLEGMLGKKRQDKTKKPWWKFW